MNILILGAGKLGFSLSGKLSAEGHSITVVDISPEALRNSGNTQDISCVLGDARDSRVLEDAGVRTAQLVIATMGKDEENLICCLLARKLGADACIARVRSPEWNKSINLLRNELGLNLVVNPELITASEISRSLRLPNATKVDFFARGRVEIVEFPVTEGSPIAGKRLTELSAVTGVSHILVCAVQRGEEIFIPNGTFTLEEGDVLSLTGTPADISQLFRKVSKNSTRIKTVFIVGGGKISYYLTEQLIDAGVDVKVIEKEYERCKELKEAHPRALILYGDGTDHETLVEEGIDTADAVVALTGLDEENVVLSMYAKERGIAKVIAKINHFSLGDFIRRNRSIDSVVTPHTIAATQVLRYVRAMSNTEGCSMIAMSRIVNDHVDAMEFKVEEGFRGIDIPLAKLKLKREILVACIIREGKVLFPHGDDCILEGDSAIIIAKRSGITELNEILA